MKIILNFLTFFFLFGCGQSAENVSTRNELATDFTKGVLKLAIVSAGCSMLSDKADANACLESALEETDKSKEETKRKTKKQTSSVRSASDEKSCSNDYSCGRGYTCIKKPYYSRGICMKKVDQYGRQDLTRDGQSRVGVRAGEGQCNYLADCPIGFKCDRTYKVCVKD